MISTDSTAKIEIFGVHGEYFCVSGPGKGDQGVELRPKLEGAIDAPVTSLWLPGAYGQTFVDFRWDRRDMVFTLFTFDPWGDDPEVWHTVDSKLRFAFDYVKETTIRFTTSDGYRELKVRLIEEPKAYATDQWEGKDPHLWAAANVVFTVGAELPFYVGKTDVYVWESDNPSGRTEFDLNVECDVPIWPRWTLTDQARWRLPDFSWGNEEFGRGVADLGRTVPLPYLPAGAGCVADSDPRRMTLMAANRMHLQGLWGGKDLLYPIAGGTYSKLPMSVKDAPNGFACKLEVPKWFTRPWSRAVGGM